jgi:anti-anti-sigma factor
MTTIEPCVATGRGELQVHHGRPGSSIVVWLRGEHDRATRAAVSAAIGATVTLGRENLVIDLSGVTFMDASTVGVIADARTALRHGDRDLVLRDPSSFARRLIELCGLVDLLERPLDTAPARWRDALSSWVAVPTRADGPAPFGCAARNGGKVP